MSVALAAMVLAIAGTAIAGVGGGGGGKEKISKRTVRSIAAKQVRKLAPGLVVARAGTAGSADSAATAANAASLNGMSVKPILFRSLRNDAPRQTIVNFPDELKLDAGCMSGGQGLRLWLVSGENDAAMTVVSMISFGADDTDVKRDIKSDVDFDMQANEDVFLEISLINDPGFHPLGARQATVQFRTPSGFVATLQFEADLRGNPAFCTVSGTAIGGRAT